LLIGALLLRFVVVVVVCHIAKPNRLRLFHSPLEKILIDRTTTKMSQQSAVDSTIEQQQGNGISSDPTYDETLTKQEPRSNLLSTSQRESMLDTFPLSMNELEYFLKSYPHFHPSVKLSTLLEVSLSATTTSNSALEADNRHIERVRYAERVFLPEANRMVSLANDDAFVMGNSNSEVEKNLSKYLEAISMLLGRRSSRAVLVLLHRLASPADHEQDPSPSDLASLMYRLILAAHFIETGRPTHVRPVPTAWVNSLSQTACNNRSSPSTVSGPDFITWVNAVAPQTHQALSSFCLCALFGPRQHDFRTDNHHSPLRFPLVGGQECALWFDTFQTAPSSIAILSAQLGGRWIRQYSSDFDGFSFAAFQQALRAYQGSHVILIQTKAGDAFGFYSAEPWKESHHWFGQGGDSFLFGLKPTLQYYGPCGGEKPHAMYLNNPIIQRPGNLYGLCVGGVAESSPRLHITPTFEGCKAQSLDGVYAMGPLLANHELYFDVDVIEMWAVNVEEDDYLKALEKGRQLVNMKEGQRLYAAKVDRRLFLEDFQEGIFGTSLFEHRQQARGRHSFVVDDEEGMGYFIDDKPRTPSTAKIEVGEHTS
jgi:hypothetical protein